MPLARYRSGSGTVVTPVPWIPGVTVLTSTWSRSRYPVIPRVQALIPVGVPAAAWSSSYCHCRETLVFDYQDSIPGTSGLSVSSGSRNPGKLSWIAEVSATGPGTVQVLLSQCERSYYTLLLLKNPHLLLFGRDLVHLLSHSSSSSSYLGLSWYYLKSKSRSIPYPGYRLQDNPCLWMVLPVYNQVWWSIPSHC